MIREIIIKNFRSVERGEIGLERSGAWFMGYNRVGLVYKLYDLALEEIEVVEEKW